VYNIDEIYWPVIELAKRIGVYQKSYFRSENMKMSTKSTDVDFVTEVDLACDRMIVDQLGEWFEEDTILSEEQGLSTGIGEYTWIIDPLDGTTNFSIGHPIFAVSIARWKNNEPVFGVVYVPMLDELFYTQSGKGAYMNHVLIVKKDPVEMGQAVLATGFPYDRASAQNNNSENVAKMVPRVKGIRRLGAAAYDLCLVAAGVLDAYWELRLGWWDLAAGMLMITESGRQFKYTEEDGKYNVVCGDEFLCETLIDELDMENGI
jgi:myo-inositol-1(or 4)-monophosphatase